MHIVKELLLGRFKNLFLYVLFLRMTVYDVLTHWI
jgi:hypothetical protein